MKLNAYINGKAIKTTKQLNIYNPSTNELLGTVSACTKLDVDQAFIDADKAFVKFKNTTIEYRIDILNKISNVLKDNVEELATIISKEVAKPFNDSKTEVIRSVDIITQTISEYKKIIKNPKIFTDKEHGVKNKIATYEIVPLGVILAITPFNYPINLLVAKLAPAIISGNTLVIKSATQGSLVTAKFIELIHKQKIDSGIINLVTGAGKEIGDYIVTNKLIKMISFTGSTNIAKKISRETTMIPLVLENGGKDPAIVMKDADLELVTKEIISGAYGYSGQRCTAIKRIIVHKSLEEELTKKLNEKINNLIVGQPFDKDVFITPLISKSSVDFSLELLKDAKDKKAKIQQPIKFENNLLWPVLVTKVKQNMLIWSEEPFAPILPMITFEKDEEAIKLANDSIYGLQASIFTKDFELAHKLSKSIEAGTINVNKSSSRGPDILPFLGVKDSGLGVQGISDAIYSMTRIKGYIENK